MAKFSSGVEIDVRIRLGVLRAKMSVHMGLSWPLTIEDKYYCDCWY